MLPQITRQSFIFGLLFIVYAVSLTVKRNASFWSKGIVDEGIVTGLLTTETAGERVGAFGSAWETANGVGKILSAIVVDASSPAQLLALALFLQGAGGIAFMLPLFSPLAARASGGGAAGAGAPLMTADRALLLSISLWAASGFAQAFIWPALSRVFLSWFPRPEQRGRWYSMLAISQNVGAAIGPELTAPAAKIWGWRARAAVPALLAIATSVAAFAALTDAPPASAAADVAGATGKASGVGSGAEAAGDAAKSAAAAAAEAANKDAAAASAASAAPLQAGKISGSQHAASDGTFAGSSPMPSVASRARRRRRSLDDAVVGPGMGGAGAAAGGGGAGSGVVAGGAATRPISAALISVLASPSVWLLSASYFFNSFVRNGLTSSFAFLLPGATASRANIAYEVGGALGGLAAGAISDKLFASRRAPAMALFGLVLVPLPLLLARLGNAPEAVTLVSYFAIGVAAFPPHTLNGLISRAFRAPPPPLRPRGCDGGSLTHPHPHPHAYPCRRARRARRNDCGSGRVARGGAGGVCRRRRARLGAHCRLYGGRGRSAPSDGDHVARRCRAAQRARRGAAVEFEGALGAVSGRCGGLRVGVQSCQRNYVNNVVRSCRRVAIRLVYEMSVAIVWTCATPRDTRTKDECPSTNAGAGRVVGQQSPRRGSIPSARAPLTRSIRS